MRKQLFALLVFFIFFGSCRKDAYKKYAGTFYLQVPLLENNNTWLVPSYDLTNVNISANKLPWSLKQVSDSEFIIETTDDTAAITEQANTIVWLAPLGMAPYSKQLFKLIPSANDPNLVSFQSVSNGKYITLPYCYKGSETFEYLLWMENADSCHAYDLPVSNQADTCYCVRQFKLQQL